jgi:hypothetical protein
MFGDMEHNSHARDISPYGQKSGKRVCEKLLSPKRDIKRIFATQIPNFIIFYILQHYGRHVTTSPFHNQEHKGNLRKLGGRTPKK